MLAVTPASDFIYTMANSQVAITGYTGASTAVEIPATIDSLPVTSIGALAFSDHSSLASVTIPASVTNIGDVPFRGCTSLTSVTVSADNTAYTSQDGVLYSKDAATLLICPAGRVAGVTIPSSVTIIGYAAFDGCRGLTSITIPSGVTTIGAGAFNQCSLTTVTIPASVVTIGDNPFASCIFLNAITVASGNTAYSSRDGVLYTKDETLLVAYPAGRAGEFAIPAGVTRVGNNAFQDCSGLTNVSIPDSVTYLGYDAFWNCTGLTSVFIPDSVRSTNNGVFGLCENLRTVRLSPSLTELAGWLFLDCQKLANVTIPSGVTTVNAGAFKECRSLTSIAIPAGVTGIGWEAFKGCTSLTAVKMQASPPTLGAEVFDGVDPSRAVVYYPAETMGWPDTFGGLPTKPYAVPEVPTAVTGIRGNGQVLLSWTAPALDGGFAVKDYTIQYSSDSGATWQTFGHAASPATSTTVTGLTNGTGYLFRIASVNDFGTGLFASTVGKIIPGLVAPPPSNVVASRGNGVVRLSWNAPLSTGGIRLVDYAVQYSTNGGASWVAVRDGVSTGTSAVLSGLVMGRDYIFRVASVGRYGAGDFSLPSGVVRPATVPTAPGRIVAVGGVGQVSVSWTAPASHGGSPIDQYLVQYAPSGGRWVTATSVAANTTSATVSGLLANRSYLFRVLAVNDIGTGPASRVVVAKTLRSSPVLV